MEIPPSIIAGLYVVEFAHVDNTVRFEQRNTLNVDGKWLGRVSNLAICQDFKKNEFLVQHCSEEWETLGIAGGYKTIEEAKNRTERSYHGIKNKWVRNNTSKEKAYALYEAELIAESCSFCGRTPLEVSAMVGGEVRICNHCIDNLHEEIHGSDKET